MSFPQIKRIFPVDPPAWGPEMVKFFEYQFQMAYQVYAILQKMHVYF